MAILDHFKQESSAKPPRVFHPKIINKNRAWAYFDEISSHPLIEGQEESYSFQFSTGSNPKLASDVLQTMELNLWH